MTTPPREGAPIDNKPAYFSAPAAPLTVDAFGVAVMLGFQFEHQFLTRRRRLERAGFPRPLPITPLRWSRAAVEDWARFANKRDAAGVLRAALLEEARRDPTVVSLENYRGSDASSGRTGSERDAKKRGVA
ncbi:hypothetical protein [Methylocystis sp.]|uniref:hypothetical protein n=1 Tax=Methylocystis sp. TaxID=1911079 RepID=UPI0027376583|nr:hypothetical protein [Methylocystis sp.]MDP3554854.1 hypothetical protein [Methylocystis sp.]